jgi:hypothetical protein
VGAVSAITISMSLFLHTNRVCIEVEGRIAMMLTPAIAIVAIKGILALVVLVAGKDNQPPSLQSWYGSGNDKSSLSS